MTLVFTQHLHVCTYLHVKIMNQNPPLELKWKKMFGLSLLGVVSNMFCKLFTFFYSNFHYDCTTNLKFQKTSYVNLYPQNSTVSVS